jgi:hypothetical protein
MLVELERLRTAAIACADAPVWSLTDADVAACVDALHAAEQALIAAKLHLLRQAEIRELPRTRHERTPAGWLAARSRLTGRSARRLAEVARATDRRPVLDQALTAATVNVEQALVIDRCLSALSTDIGAEATAKAEALLIGWAADFDADGLRHLGRKLLWYVAPDIAEQREAAAVARDEATGFETRTLSISDAGDGRVRVRGWLDTEAAAIVSAALDPLCSPRRSASTLRTAAPEGAPSGAAPSGAAPFAAAPDPTADWELSPAERASQDAATADDRTPGQRRADALVEVCRLILGTGDLPANGGDRPQLTITAPFDVLTGELGVGTLDTGQLLTPTQVRRLACDAQILPAVLGTEGQVLDVGQSRRLFTGPLRRALVLRDRGCAFPGCTRPPRWCDGHHVRSWLDGGPTSLDNAVLLCGPHHRMIHHSPWEVRFGHDGHPEFLPPPELDPAQLPRRNSYHRRT